MPGVDLVNTHQPGQPREPATTGHQTLPPHLDPTDLEEDKPMPNQRFTLIVEGADLQSQPLIDELFEAGCGDATFGRSDGVQYADFDREAPSPGAAILSAVRDIEQFEGVHVTGVIDVEPAVLTGTTAPTERARESPRPPVATAPRPDEVPTPEATLRSPHRLWPWSGGTSLPTRLAEQAPDRSSLALVLDAGLEFPLYDHDTPAVLRDSLRTQARSLVTGMLEASA